MSLIEDPVNWVAAQRADPVRRRMLHALALRAAAQPQGALRDKLIVAIRQRASRAPLVHQKQHYPALGNPLAELLALLEFDASPELRQVRIHENTWRELRVARSIADLHAPVAGHLGPLNGQALATRVLQQIQLLAPDYLHRLLAQMDAIAALELMQAAGEAEKPARTAKKKAPERRR
ncbi:DUF2894 domain-containing protein [Roseateles oligotrophus]|uniref:DUF2894 domain-containing protein n=1 Tax=Roseateles oligotrophus TaxID=1769250 RepID=A0ABT2YDK7_9BURK|nr:DUF2894 domain-containing protein [Roseateles oligotrophus]MCV2368137.1 DUF2894 domain-containing protein [Roseateles oligotrophus]